LLRRDLEIPAILVGLGPKEREQAWQRKDEDQYEYKIELGNHQENEHRKSHQPEPRRKRGYNSSTVQKTNWHEIE